MESPLPDGRGSDRYVDGECVFPVSFAQARLWFIDQLDLGSTLYNMPAAHRMRGRRDISVMRRCLDEIVRRHESLRTTFRTEAGQPVQVIAPSRELAMPVIDLSALDQPERDAVAGRIAAEEGRLPFDISCGPLLRVKVVRLAEDDLLLFVTFHHIISDGWSLGVFFRELSILYQAFSAGLPSPLPELPIQYADFAVWQREMLQGATLAGHLDYWKAQLRGAPALLELPADRPRPPVQSFRGAACSFQMPLERQEAVQALGRSLSATPFMVLLAAYAVLLFRHSRQSDMVIGAAIANRTRAELEGLIGFFVNMLALRLDLEGAPSFRELVARVREVTLGAYAHQDLPFERLVDELAPERSLSHSPVVQVSFGLQNTPFFDSEGAPDELSLSTPSVTSETAKFDLVLFMQESPAGLLASFEYNTDIFDAATIERMAQELTVLLAAATSQPGRPITDLPLLPAEERNRVLFGWNETAAPFPGGACLHELFGAQVERTPDVEAVVCGDLTLTYRALAVRSNQLAHHLRRLGVGPEARVGICLPRASQVVVAILGTAAAGGAYVPLDPGYPRDRLAYMLDDAAASLLLTESALAADLPELQGATVVCLDALDTLLAELPADQPSSGVTARNLAYLIYTSGSTGRPKGVLVEHRSIANMCTAEVYEIGPGARVLQMAPLSFDASVCELCCALTSGATLVIGSADEQLPGPELVRLIQRQQVTTMILAPSVLAAVPAEESLSLPIRVLAMAGEACPAELVKRWVAPGRRLFNSYGPTEATIWACSASDIDGSRPPPIGFALANVQIYLLDEALEPVPLGVVGEVFLGGAGVTRGYHARPEPTAAKFLPDPFGGEPGARLYRTGDLARRLPNGDLEFARRVDHQVKLRGYRVETGEIEAVLSEHPALKAAAVVCREASPGRRELTAYLVEGSSAPSSDLYAALRGELQREWQTVFDETFREARPGAGSILDTVGWKSSYTGEPLSPEEMEAWASATAAGILALGPRRVLEVGCGAGLILHRVAPRVERYTGIDISAVALEQLAADVRARGLTGVHLERRDAAALSGLGERGFDVVVLNSVVQYFPSLDFLLQVITSALALLADRGALFLGDVRSLPHLLVQHASVQRHRAPSASRADLREAAQRACAREQELVIDPELFHALPERIPGLAGVDVHLRRGRHMNEMTKFRYDVVIRKGPPHPASIVPARVDASRLPAPLEALRRILAEDPPQALSFEGLLNRRLVEDIRILDDLEGDVSVDPEDILALGESLGYTAHVSFSSAAPAERFDALLVRHGIEGSLVGRARRPAAPVTLANDPVAGRRERALLQSVRAHLERRLPSFMIPASFELIDVLPLSPSGKVDRRALVERGLRAAPGLSGSDAAYRPPRNAVEETLAQIWTSVLRLPRVGIHDNFFEIGGDSILSIQIVSQAQQRGISLTPRQMFQHQTIAGLSAVAGASRPSMAEQGPVTGAAPLTPVQRWWLESSPLEPHHFNQALLLEAREAIEPVALAQAVARLLEHHDALRLRLTAGGDGARMLFAAPGGPSPLQQVSFAALPDDRRLPAMQRAAATAQASLDLDVGPVVRVVLFELAAGVPARILLAVHHLAVDAVSWKILLEDLWTAYQAARRGAPLVLPSKTTSFKRWSELLSERAGSDAVLSELERWQHALRGAAGALPIDHRTGPNDGSSARHVGVSLSPEETERLLREAPAAFRARIDDLLVTAFAVAVSRWTGSSKVLFDIEGHGREDLFAGVDLTRTVGWFAAMYPVVLDMGKVAASDAVALVQRSLADMPGRGLGYGLLRFLRPDTREALRALPSAELCFNYLGQLDQAIPEGAPLVSASESAGPTESPIAERTHLVEVNTWVAGGRFHADWAFSEHRHQRATLERVATSFVEVLRGLLGLTTAPQDEDRYPLSPLQEGILFHARTTPSEGVYLVQTSWTMEGALDPEALCAALQQLVDRHSILRTSFAWEGLDSPVQIVHAGVVFPVEQRDLRALTPEEQDEELERHAAGERRRGFELTAAPLMRVALLRLREDAYRLVWTLHHVIMDGWSMPIVLEELFALYQARVAGRAAALEPPARFRDYIEWLGGRDRTRDASFWRSELAGFTAATPFGVEEPSPREPRAGWQQLAIEGDSAGELLAVGQQCKVTLSSLVHGAWALLLSRYSGEEDVLFGATVSGRSAPVPGIFRMVGLLINTLPVRVRASQDASVGPWLAELQAHLAEVREHEHSALLDVMAQSDLPRGATLFESLLVFENYPVQPLPQGSLGGLRITGAGHFDDPAYPLTLLAAQRGAIHLELGYDRRRFDDAAVARLMGHLASILAGVARQPKARLSELTLLSDGERRLLASFNDTEASFPRDACLHELFEAQAVATPEAPALLFEGRVVDYRELSRRAGALASHLRALGVARGTRVGICAERSPEAIAGILGVLAAGGAYVPLDPSYPEERLGFMIEDARLGVILSDARSSSRLSGRRVEVVLLDAGAPASIRGDALGSGVTAAEPAYVIYTSGSTGRPKGVVGTHRGMVNRCAWMWRRYPFQPGEVTCQKTSFSFVDSVWEIFGPLLRGVPSVVLPEARVQDLSRFIEVLAVAGVSRVVLVPSLLRALLDVVPDLGRRLPGLGMVTSSGEVLSRELAASFRRAMPGRSLLDVYGSSEVAADATCAEHHPSLQGEVRGTIGAPIANTRAYVLDAVFQPAPLGVPGELYIGGEGLALGYLDRPGLTAERFVPDPFSDDPSARLFRTGDRVRRVSSGELEYLGRLDDQVKIRGVRVELAEVRAALLEHASVRDAAVVARADERGELRLVAHVVGSASGSELFAFLRARLPAAMVPSAFVSLDALPLLPNGKLDRRALPSSAEPAGHVAPRDPVEEQIAAIWAEVLGIELVDVTAGFFELGGNSLLLARVHDRLSGRFERPVAIVDLLAHPTVASLARLLGAPAGDRVEQDAAGERARRRRQAAARRSGRGRDHG